MWYFTQSTLYGNYKDNHMTMRWRCEKCLSNEVIECDTFEEGIDYALDQHEVSGCDGLIESERLYEPTEELNRVRRLARCILSRYLGRKRLGLSTELNGLDVMNLKSIVGDI